MRQKAEVGHVCENVNLQPVVRCVGIFYTKQTSVFSISSTRFRETKRKQGKNKGEDKSLIIYQAKRSLNNYQL